ncbi:MAG TPA: ATP synthase F0 subunit B [Candidatus Angelobacter sp.]|nr:ATP synthase F0 subunit B [Candidatus Angelobacter sp.]
MTTRIQKIWIHALLGMALLVPSSVGVLRAQEPAKPTASPKPIDVTPEGQLGKAEEKEEKAKGEQEEKNGRDADAIRHSPSVHWLASKTGMSDDQAYWLCLALNFAVIFIAIGYLMRKHLPGFFSGRTAMIQKGIEEARKTSEEARRRLAEVESRLSRIDSEIATMQHEAEENARAEERRILAAGEEERRRIVASAEQEIAMAANAARRELKSYAAELAVDLAEKKIRVNQATDEALVRSFTTQLGKDGN